MRSRVAEETLAEAISGGVRQYVVLGAGLDTFALRNQDPSLRVFEVDHPNTQAWKRKRLEEEGLGVPACLRFVPVDFTRQDLKTELLAAGLDPGQPTFFSWLGVVMYLEESAIRATFQVVASLSGDAGGLVFDFISRPKPHHLLVRFLLWFRKRRVAKLGEPFRSLIRPEEARLWLEAAGFARVDILDSATLNQRYLSGRKDLRVASLIFIAVARGGVGPMLK